MKKQRICIVGLGYVGLPLAHAFAKKGWGTIGYDISEARISELKEGKDRTNELTAEELAKVNIRFSNDPSVIGEGDIVILAIPTPVDDANNPDLTLVESASETVGTHMKKGTIIVYESTVYPGTTEEICGPILERASGMKQGEDFWLGYSPERVNPGDRHHTIEKIVKIVSGQDEKTLKTLCDVYGSIIEAGVHPAESIKVAEMAKAIENAQRDLNIAFVNEIAMLCDRVGIPTKAVLEAAGTKWNFLKFQPGLVGGHCIGVDPYYLVEKARQLGMQTHVITAGRAVNDGMSSYIAHMVQKELPHTGEVPRILILGLTFKEDVPDTRNSKSFDVVNDFTAAGAQVFVHDPFVESETLARKKLSAGSLEDGPFDAILLLVGHKEYRSIPTEQYIKATKESGVIFDLKSVLDGEKIKKAGRMYKAL